MSASVPGAPSCDRCRVRKVKCVTIPDDELAIARSKGVGDRCKGCYRADKACTRDYVHKKPGRPLGSGRRQRRPSSSRTPRLTSPTPPFHEGIPGLDPAFHGDGIGPAFGSIFGSARHTLYPGQAYAPMVPLFDPEAPSAPALNMPDLGLLNDPLGVAGDHSSFGVEGGGGASRMPAIASPSTGSNTTGISPANAGPGPSSAWTHNLPANMPSTESNPSPLASLDVSLDFRPGAGVFSLDDVLPWVDVCFFVSLFLKEQHCLVPLVHKPTFSQDVLSRRDKRDESFAGLLCSMIAYTICQCPISTMTGAFDRSRLVTIMHRCTKAADRIRHRQRMSPSLIQLASAVLDWISGQAVGDPQVCDLLVADTTRLVHALGLNEPHPRAASNTIEVQICRRLFWIVYTKDKTDILSGRPVLLHDFEGVPPLPLEVDDDYITTEGSLPQPRRRTSIMVGFTAIVRIFQVISQCVVRHRTFANRAAACADDVSNPSPVLDDDDHMSTIRWIAGAHQTIRDILDGLPPTHRTDLADTDLDGDEVHTDRDLFGIQQANITITALCAEFALLDFRASLRPDEDTRADREDMARKAYTALSSIPYEYLASNGESMRGKVLRIILSLLSMTTEPVQFSADIWQWWNMYSRVQFLQAVPDQAVILIDQNQPHATPPQTV